MPNYSKLPQIISVVQEFQEVALHAHSEKDMHNSGCIVCGKF